MKKNGFTLVEVILAIALIGLISVTFIPAMTFGYKYLIDSEKFVVDSYAKQQEVEKLLDAKRDEVAGSTDVLQLNIFGVNVKGHVVTVDIEGHGEINTFQPQRTITYDVLQIIPKGHAGNPDVLLDVVSVSPRPAEVSMYTAGSLNATAEFLVNENNFTVSIPSIHLVNVYRWFLSSEQELDAGFVLDNYTVIKEWNAARNIISYAESKTLKTIANMQNDPDYNRLTFTEIKTGLGLTDEEMINRFGNRFVYYSVTPYAISGRVGVEDLSNAIYIRAPRIEIDKAYYGSNPKQVEILFKESISDVINSNMIATNEALGTLVSATRSATNDKILILEFEDNLDGVTPISGNSLSKGAVASLIYGNISIWGEGDPHGNFTVNYVAPTPVTSVTVTPSSLTLAVGGTNALSAAVLPVDATNLTVTWESNHPEIVSVDATGNLVGVSSGTAIITARSVSNPSVTDTCNVVVPMDSNAIGAELDVALDNLLTLSIANPSNANVGPKPVISTPSETSDGILYTFTAGDSSGGTTVGIQSGNKTAIVTRDNTTTYTLNITLTASKSNGVTDVTRSKIFKVYIPSNGTPSASRSVLISEPLDSTAIQLLLTNELAQITTLVVSNPTAASPTIQAPNDEQPITYAFTAGSADGNAKVIVTNPPTKIATVTRRPNQSRTLTIVLTATYTNGIETITSNKTFNVLIPSGNSAGAVTVTQ